MTFDLQAILAAFFYIFAYAAPLWLTLAHLLEQAGGLPGPRFYAGVVATLAVIAMNARIGTFLETHITEAVGSFETQTLVALFTAGAASLGLAVFAWILPAISTRLSHLFEAVAPPDAANQGIQPSAAFALDYDARSPLNRGTALLITMTGDLLAATAGIVATAVYLMWPALPLAVDGQRSIVESAIARQQEEAVKTYERELRSYSIAAGAKANELLHALAARSQLCSTDSCRAATTRRLEQSVTALSGWKILPSADGVFMIDSFTSNINDSETAHAVHARIDDLAKRHRIALLTRATPPGAPGEQSFDAAEVERKERVRRDQNLANTARELTFAISEPRRALSLIAADFTMAMAIGLELAAIALTLGANFNARGRHA